MGVKDVVKALLQWVFLLFFRIIGIVIGLVVVAIAIQFRVEGVSGSDGRRIVNLPKWAWMWGNDFDGLLGDKRGWWDNNTPFGVKPDSFLAMYWWAAIRNPANNMRFMDMFSAPVVGSKITYTGDYVVEDEVGGGGWQFVRAEQDGKKWYGCYYVKEWRGGKGTVVRFGFKLKPSHANTVEPRKGLTYRFFPWKTL